MKRLSSKAAIRMVLGRPSNSALTKRFGRPGCDVYVLDTGQVVVIKDPRLGSPTADMFENELEFLAATPDYSYLANIAPKHILEAIGADFQQVLRNRKEALTQLASELGLSSDGLCSLQGVDALAKKIRNTKRGLRWPHYFHAVVLVFGTIITSQHHARWALLNAIADPLVFEPWIFEVRNGKYCNLFKVPYHEMVESNHLDLLEQFETVSRLQWKDSSFVETLYHVEILEVDTD